MKTRLAITSEPALHLCEPGWRFSKVLADYDLWYILSGSGWLTINGQRYELGPHLGIIMPPGAQVAAGQDPARRLTVFYLHFTLKPPVPLPVRAQAGNALLLAELARRCVAAYKTPPGPTGWNEAELCLQQILLHLCRDAEQSAGRADPAMAEALAAVRTEPGKTWTVPMLAENAHLSRVQFTRRFTHFAGLSPGRFLIQEKVKRALELLRHSGMNVSEIAAAMGYNDVFYFSKQIKRETGRNPGWFKLG